MEIFNMLTKTLNTIPTPVADAATPQAELRTPSAPPAVNENQPEPGKPQILEEVVIEEVSIDGMCGVY
jgi:mycofactocin precursor